jgi:hypothetical protein
MTETTPILEKKNTVTIDGEAFEAVTQINVSEAIANYLITKSFAAS